MWLNKHFKIKKVLADGRKRLLRFAMNKNKTIEEKLYEAIGVKHFKRGLMFCVRAFIRSQGKSIDNMAPKMRSNYTLCCEGKPQEFLAKHKKNLWFNGLWHSAFGAICVPFFLYGMATHNMFSMISQGSCIAINSYCVMLQRYNFIRIKRAIRKAFEHNEFKEDLLDKKVNELEQSKDLPNHIRRILKDKKFDYKLREDMLNLYRTAR